MGRPHLQSVDRLYAHQRRLRQLLCGRHVTSARLGPVRGRGGPQAHDGGILETAPALEQEGGGRGRAPEGLWPEPGRPFDAEVSDDWRADYLAVIQSTPWLDWILLTKRPQVAVKFFTGRKVPDNLWPGITAEDQKMLDLRAPAICSIAARVHVLSAEPLLGPVVASAFLGPGLHALSWVIAGGESGPRARPPRMEWVRSLRDQCRASRVAFFWKQWGEYTPQDPSAAHTSMRRVGKKAAGAVLDGRAWREFPT